MKLVINSSLKKEDRLIRTIERLSEEKTILKGEKKITKKEIKIFEDNNNKLYS